MVRMLPRFAAAAVLLVLPVTTVRAQTYDAVGARAGGMGGAFVAVADDASAAYWNPAGFAAGSFFSLVLDRNAAKVSPEAGDARGSRSALLIALGAPALGLSYYRLRTTIVEPLFHAATDSVDGRNPGGAGEVHLETLTTHHTGATLVQSVAPGIAVGATLKLVRGIASSTVQVGADPDDLLSDGSDLTGKASTRFDADVGVMATAGVLKAGLTIRNATEPSFKTPGDKASLELQRQARAGLAVTPARGWIFAADLDLLETRGPLGSRRGFATGLEGRVARKAFVRGGLNINTVGDRATAVSGGFSYAATASLLVDAQVTRGPDRAERGWGIAARFGF